jgi:phytoene dehydrogenase-like protein
MKTVIIGSGMSGLTAGAYLARAGHSVTVFEQFSTPGGVTATVSKDGFSWDLGPLLLEGFAPGDKGRVILEDLGVSERVKVVREDRDLSMPEFTLRKPEEYEGPYWRRERLKTLFPAESGRLDRYYRFYDLMLGLMSLARRAEIAHGLAALWLKFRMLIDFLQVKGMVNWNGTQLMDHYFKSTALKAVFLGLAADYITAPSEFPALGVPSLHPETMFDKRLPAYPGTKSARGAFCYIIGGLQTMVDAVAGAILDNGGKITTNTAVKKIVVENGRVKGVGLADGRFEAADQVLASGGMREVFFDLVGKEKLPSELISQIESVRLMESVHMVQLGIDFDPTPYQPSSLCYYYYTYDLEGCVKRLRAGDYHEGKEGLLIYVPSLHSPSMAPSGHYAVTIYTVAPDKLTEGSWSSRREELTDKLVAVAERHIPGLRQHTKTRLILTPEDFRLRTHLKHHSFGGVPPVIGNKPPSHKTFIQGLWFIGAQSESGGGVVNVMTGAQKTVKQILRDR